METDDAAQVSELVDVLESTIVDNDRLCVMLLFVNIFVFLVLTERPTELACCSFSSVPGLEYEKAERSHLHILDLRVKSKDSI